MKSKLILGSFLFVMAFAMSCSKEQNPTSTLSGEWKISSLVVNGTDKTQEVAGYTISFDDHGMMSVHDSSDTFNCGWQDNSSMMHDGMGDYHFDMGGCPNDSPMQMLNSDWVMDNLTEHACSFHEKDASNTILSLEKI